MPENAEMPEFLEKGPKQLLIGGRWMASESGDTFETVNPSTGEVLTEVAAGGQEDIDKAVEEARAAFDGPWRDATPDMRQQAILHLADLVLENAEELGTLDSLDMGMPVALSRGGGRWASRLRFYSALPHMVHGETIPNSMPGDVFTYTLREPVGVVGGITPWNGPVTAALLKIGPVLATGCTLVLKPAEQSPLSALLLGELISKTEIPPGVINIVTGVGETAGAALASHTDVDKIAFTGSQAVGREIVRASAGNLKRVTLELGGKSPNVVFADSDIEVAATNAAMAVFLFTGQICSAATRLLVEESIHDQFVERVSAVAQSLKVGNSMDPTTQLGPLVSDEALQRVTNYISTGVDEGATLVQGGHRIEDNGLNAGFFVEPTVFTEVDSKMTIAQEEIFGPVLSAMPFTDIDEAIERANGTPYGLGAGVWTRDVKKAQYLTERISAGMVWVNGYHLIDPAIPWGGYRMSGYGREGSVYEIDEYTNLKSVIVVSG